MRPSVSRRYTDREWVGGDKTEREGDDEGALQNGVVWVYGF